MSLFEETRETILKVERLLHDEQSRRIHAERDVNRLERALGQASAMIETLMNELADKVGETDNVKAARICISIINGYAPPFSPVEEYPDVKDMPRMKHYVEWSMARREDLKKRLAEWEGE